MFQKLLRFVQRGRILLRCGSALALSLPSLGVSSLDLGRLFIQAALFSCAMFFAMRLSRATAAKRIPRTHRRPKLLFCGGLERSEVAERNSGQRIGERGEI